MAHRPDETVPRLPVDRSDPRVRVLADGFTAAGLTKADVKCEGCEVFGPTNLARLALSILDEHDRAVAMAVLRRYVKPGRLEEVLDRPLRARDGQTLRQALVEDPAWARRTVQAAFVLGPSTY